MDFVKKLFSFDSMITPKLIKIIFAIGLVLSVIYGILIIVFFTANDAGFLGFLGGLLFIVISPLLVRIWTEIIIVPFEILGELKKLNNK